MISLNEYIKEQEFNNIFERYLLDELRVSLHCWVKTGIGYDLPYYVPTLLESYKYNFNNCKDVVKTIVDYISNDDSNIKDHSRTFKFDNITFFDKLQIHFILQGNSGYVKSKSKKNVVYIQLKLLDKPFEEYTLREHRFFIYTIIHELTHAYADYLLRIEGKPSIIYLMKGNYAQEYTNAVKWMRPFTKNPNVKNLLGKCRYFLDEQEMVAYLGTVKETVTNIFNTIKPSYKDLKFDELLKLFSEEYIWSEYLDISKFIENIDDIDKDELLKCYNKVFNKDVDYNYLIGDIKDKWETFKSEFVQAFIEAYADCEEEIKLESFVSFGFNYFERFSNL